MMVHILIAQHKKTGARVVVQVFTTMDKVNTWLSTKRTALYDDYDLYVELHEVDSDAN